MNSMQGPAIFLAQFLRDVPPYNSLDAIAGWVSGLGRAGMGMRRQKP